VSKKIRHRLKKAWGHFRTTWPLYAAAAVTIGFAYWTYGLAFESLIDESGVSYTRWEEFKNGQPNTMGDTLAGFVGSLTLIWVVASVIQQSMELKAQRQEFAEMVTAQENQAAQLAKQVEILDYQLVSLKHRDLKSHLDQLVKVMVRQLRELSELAHWEVHSRGISMDANGKQTEVASINKCAMFSIGSGEVESQINQAILGIRHFMTRVSITKDIVPRHGKKSAAKPLLLEIVSSIESAFELQASLSPPDLEWLLSLRLDTLREVLTSLSEMDLWDQSGHYGYVVAIQ
jgi:hypothetical protein